MIGDAAREGDTGCWKDEDDVWQLGTVRAVHDRTVSVEDRSDGRVSRIDTGSWCPCPPTIPFKTTRHPKSPSAQVFLSAVYDAIERAGFSPDDIGLLWTDGTPIIVFAGTVPERHIDAVREDVDEHTPGWIAAGRQDCTAVQLTAFSPEGGQ